MQENNADLKENVLPKVIEWVKSKGYNMIKANAEGYDLPSKFKMPDSEIEFVPDVTGMRRDSKNYFEVALKTEEPKLVIRKWRLLSTLAKMKNGSLYLFAPSGHKAFVQRVLDNRQIEAKIISI